MRSWLQVRWLRRVKSRFLITLFLKLPISASCMNDSVGVLSDRESVLIAFIFYNFWCNISIFVQLQNVPRLGLLRRDHHHRDSCPRRCSGYELSVRGFRRDFRRRERCLQMWIWLQVQPLHLQMKNHIRVCSISNVV